MALARKVDFANVTNEESVEEKYNKILVGQLLLIGCDEKNLPKNVRTGEIDIFNKTAFEHVMYTLFTKLDSVAAVAKFRNCWPVNDRKSEQQFRSVCANWIKVISEGEPDYQLQRNIGSILMNPSGRKFNKFLKRFILFVFNKFLDKSTTLNFCSLWVNRYSKGQALKSHLIKAQMMHHQNYQFNLEEMNNIYIHAKNLASKLEEKYRMITQNYRQKREILKNMMDKPYISALVDNWMMNRVVPKPSDILNNESLIKSTEMFKKIDNIHKQGLSIYDVTRSWMIETENECNLNFDCLMKDFDTSNPFYKMIVSNDTLNENILLTVSQAIEQFNKCIPNKFKLPAKLQEDTEHLENCVNRLKKSNEKMKTDLPTLVSAIEKQQEVLNLIQIPKSSDGYDYTPFSDFSQEIMNRFISNGFKDFVLEKNFNSLCASEDSLLTSEQKSSTFDRRLDIIGNNRSKATPMFASLTSLDLSAATTHHTHTRCSSGFFEISTKSKDLSLKNICGKYHIDHHPLLEEVSSPSSIQVEKRSFSSLDITGLEKISADSRADLSPLILSLPQELVDEPFRTPKNPKRFILEFDDDEGGDMKKGEKEKIKIKREKEEEEEGEHKLVVFGQQLATKQINTGPELTDFYTRFQNDCSIEELCDENDSCLIPSSPFT